jgi:DNA-binding winged helix-turn-helix (wHTH) protein
MVDQQHLSLGGQQQRTVLGVLVASAGTPVSTDLLIESIWGDDIPSGVVRQAL